MQDEPGDAPPPRIMNKTFLFRLGNVAYQINCKSTVYVSEERYVNLSLYSRTLYSEFSKNDKGIMNLGQS